MTDTLADPPAATGATEPSHQESIDAAGATYVVHVGGCVDGESLRDPVGYGNYGQSWENNLWARLENLGDDVVVDPWIHVDGRRRWACLEQILDDILEPGMGDGERARAIWEFARRHRYHATTGDDEVKDTVKMLNVYGYTLCWDEAYTLSNLWQAAGLTIRRGLPHGHCTTEVFYDGGWHLLDSDEHLLVLGRDNETVVGETEISRDHDLMKRSHAYGINSPEDRARAEAAAALFCHDGGRGGTRPRLGGHRMSLRLRPGEALEWRWDAGRGRYHGLGGPPPRFCNGRLLWTPRLDAAFDRWTETTAGARSDGREVTADALAWRLQPPYVVVGGRVDLCLGGVPARLELSRDGGPWLALTDGEAHGDLTVDLDPAFPPDSPPTYDVRLRLAGTQFTLSHLQIELTLQMAPLSLPALRLGDNLVTYTDASASRRVRVTHAWRERADLVAPPAPVPLSPADGGGVAGTAPTLAWSDVCGDGGDYHVRLGTDPQLRQVLSPVFDKIVSRTPSKGRPEWTVPETGLLNPGRRYHWQVRARSADGLWGPWSDTASFTPQAPGVPLDVRLDVDWETRRGTVRWRANPVGTPPVRYEIHGSDERGFSARREAYHIVSGASDTDGRRAMPANLLTTAAVTHATVVGAGIDAGNRAFYRVVAVDADGVRSGPSDYAEAPRPFVCTSPPTRIRAGETTAVTLETIRSLGDLRAESDGPHRYRLALRDGDTPTFVLDEGPAFIDLDAGTGRLTLRPEARDASTHTVTVRVKSGQGGVDVIGFDLTVVLHD